MVQASLGGIARAGAQQQQQQGSASCKPDIPSAAVIQWEPKVLGAHSHGAEGGRRPEHTLLLTRHDKRHVHKVKMLHDEHVLCTPGHGVHECLCC